MGKVTVSLAKNLLLRGLFIKGTLPMTRLKAKGCLSTQMEMCMMESLRMGRSTERADLCSKMEGSMLGNFSKMSSKDMGCMSRVAKPQNPDDEVRWATIE